MWKLAQMLDEPYSRSPGLLNLLCNRKKWPEKQEDSIFVSACRHIKWRECVLILKLGEFASMKLAPSLLFALFAAFQKTVLNLEAARVRACPRLNFGWMHIWIRCVASLSLLPPPLLPLPLSTSLCSALACLASLPPACSQHVNK